MVAKYNLAAFFPHPLMKVVVFHLTLVAGQGTSIMEKVNSVSCPGLLHHGDWVVHITGPFFFLSRGSIHSNRDYSYLIALSPTPLSRFSLTGHKTIT